MAIHLAWGTMSSPTGVSDGDLLEEDFCLVDGRCLDEFSETGNLSYVLEADDRVWCIAINANAWVGDGRSTSVQGQ